MEFSNKTYDVLKAIAQIWIPALSALYFALAQIWNLPYAEQIVGTLAAIDTFLGAILGISSSNYKKGDIDVEIPEGELVFEDKDNVFVKEGEDGK